MRHLSLVTLIGSGLLVVCGISHAGGPLLIDHRVNYTDSGIWKSSYQDAVVIGASAAVIAGALWEGGDERLGRTLWQSVDALALSVGTTEALKYGFTRTRPADNSDPGKFFQGSGNDSFPSLHVAALAGAITPIVLEYGQDHPLVYGLGGLIAYEMIGRVKIQEHWQSDVLISAAIGTVSGVLARHHDQPFFLSYVPNGMAIGLKKDF